MTVKVITGGALGVLCTLPDKSAHCCVTSPPYWGLRDYGHEEQIGLEPTPHQYVQAITLVFQEVWRVLRDDGTLWLNVGDSYAGSWGAQSRPDYGDSSSALEGGSMLSARQIQAHPKGTHIGSLKNTPGLKAKDLVGIPWRVAFALQATGWYLRSDIIWSKPNPMPESVTDRPTKAHEYIFLLSKSERYYYDAGAIAEPVSESMLEQLEQGYNGTATKDYASAGAQDPSAVKARILKRSGNKTRKYRYENGGNPEHGSGQAYSVPWEGITRNKRTVWTVTTKPYSGAHFATFPPDLIEPCILAGCPEGGTVLDPFFGAGTTGLVADRLQRNCIGIELNPAYADMARERIRKDAGMFAEVA